MLKVQIIINTAQNAFSIRRKRGKKRFNGIKTQRD